MLRKCLATDFDDIFSIINDAARAYKGTIPADCWHDPYMTKDYLQSEINDGVAFWGYEKNNRLIGVMGIQDRGEITLMRHAYVRPDWQNKGLGSRLLRHLETLTDKAALIGTWKAAQWAIDFYKKNGYTLVSEEEKNRLLKKYWRISERQIETSVVLIKVYQSTTTA